MRDFWWFSPKADNFRDRVLSIKKHIFLLQHREPQQMTVITTPTRLEHKDDPTSIVQALLDQPRNPISPLSFDNGSRRPEYYRLPVEKQRFITVLEQIAYIEGIGGSGVVYQGGGKGVRKLNVRINIPQPSLRDYLSGNVADPLGISSKYFENIARGRRVSPHTLRCMIKGEEIFGTPEDLLAAAWTADLQSLLPALEVINYRLLSHMGVSYQPPLSVYGVDLAKLSDHAESALIKSLKLNLPIDLSAVADKVDSLPDLEQEQLELEPEPEPEPVPYEGNLKILSKLQLRLAELSKVGISLEQAFQLYSLNQEMLEELETSTEPIPDEWLAGPIMRATGLTTEELLNLRDGDKESEPKAKPSARAKTMRTKKPTTKR